MYALTYDPSKKLISIPDLARFLSISRSQAYRLVQRGEIASVRVGERRVMVSPDEVEKLLREP